MEIHSVDSFLRYLTRVRQRTDVVLEVVPAEDIEWAPTPRHFSFGDLLRHVAALERWMFAETIAGRPSAYPGHGRELAEGHEAVMAYYRDRRAEALQIYRDLSDSDLDRKCVTPGGAELSVWKWLRAMIEHEMHHRGQLYLMASMRGYAPPPLYGLTSEQVRERSR